MNEKDTRQRKHFQTYRSETKTLAICRDIVAFAQTHRCTFVNARVRIRKEDRRLPLQFVIAFEPDGGSPDLSIIATSEDPKISVRELVLFNRSYIPIVNRLGSVSIGGPVSFATRKGSLGAAIDITAECDAVDISLHLVQALGDIDATQTPIEGRAVRYGGRWICGYCITVNDRMSSEEWEEAVQRCNMQVEVYSDAVNGVPVIINGLFYDHDVDYDVTDPAKAEQAEGTGGDDIPNDVVIDGTGDMG
jgi:hypothetical protein